MLIEIDALDLERRGWPPQRKHLHASPGGRRARACVVRGGMFKCAGVRQRVGTWVCARARACARVAACAFVRSCARACVCVCVCLCLFVCVRAWKGCAGSSWMAFRVCHDTHPITCSPRHAAGGACIHSLHRHACAVRCTLKPLLPSLTMRTVGVGTAEQALSCSVAAQPRVSRRKRLSGVNEGRGQVPRSDQAAWGVCFAPPAAGSARATFACTQLE